MLALVGARTERSGFDLIMKFVAFAAAFGLLIGLATVTPAVHETKDERSERVERSMPVDPQATITVCVMSGAISARGWDKNEVRVRLSGAEVLEFRRIDKIKEKDKAKQVLPPATRVDVMIMDSADRPEAKGDCQAIADVELEVPHGATVQVQTRDGDIHIVGVAAAYAGSQNGDITIERAAKLVEAGSVGGSISLKDSAGRMNLSSAGGVVDVTNCKPAATDDTFEVNTVSGDIQLSDVTNRKLFAKTVNGSVTMTGPLAKSGQYGFNTLSGDVILELPSDASFHIIAKLSDNREIVSDFKLKFLETPPAPPTPNPMPAPGAVPRRPGAKSSASAGPGIKDPALPGPGVKSPPSSKSTPAPPAVKSPAPTVKPPATTSIVIKPSVVIVPYSLRRVAAMHGSGDAMISVASFSGTLHLKKL
jgi:Toastrack DUF4097